MTALPTVGDINYPSAAEIRDNALRTIKIGLSRVGITVNVLPQSEVYYRADAWARRAVIAFANNRIRYEDLNPLTAKGDALVQVAGIFGVTKRPATKSTGFVTITCTGASVSIPTGYRAIAPNGETYTVITGAVIPDGGAIEVQSVNKGAVTKQAHKVKLTWTSSSIGTLNRNCVVAVGGIDGGVDADTEEKLRERLLDRLANPAADDNVARIRQLAENASAAVWKSYVYSSVRGPSTTDVALVAEEGDRTLSTSAVGSIGATVIAALSGHADINVTSVVAEPVNVILTATLPLPNASGGAGGGWVDGTPYPSGTPVAGSNDGRVTAYAAGVATVRTTTAPVVGRHISIWDSAQEKMFDYVVATVGGVSGAYTITVQGLDGAAGFAVNPRNGYVSATATNLSLYAEKFLELMLTLGPGEKSESADVLPRGRRQPIVNGSNPRDLDNRLTVALMAAYPELDCSYGLRLDATALTARTSPSVPGDALLPPRILTLRNFALWKA